MKFIFTKHWILGSGGGLIWGLHLLAKEFFAVKIVQSYVINTKHVKMSETHSFGNSIILLLNKTHLKEKIRTIYKICENCIYNFIYSFQNIFLLRISVLTMCVINIFTTLIRHIQFLISDILRDGKRVVGRQKDQKWTAKAGSPKTSNGSDGKCKLTFYLGAMRAVSQLGPAWVFGHFK